jgi:hypothetical protein
MFLSQYGEPLANRLPVWKDFRIYSTTYWARHCKLAATHRTEGVLKDFFEFFLSNESDPTSPLALWTKTLRHRFDIPAGERYPVDFELDEQMQEIIAASAIPVFLACSFDFPEVIADQISRKGFRADYTNGKGHTALQVKFGSCEVITVMLNDGTAQITEEVVRMAARSYRGKEVMELLLDRRGDEVKITDEVVQEAAGSYRGEVMELLLDREVIELPLDRRGDEVKITDEVVQAAA